MTNSRTKGKVGELELAAFFRERGFDHVRRGQQFKGGADSPDVIGVPGLHIECKRTEAGNMYHWLAQAVDDASFDAIPVVAHRKNGKKWLAILDLEDFVRLYKQAIGFKDD